MPDAEKQARKTHAFGSGAIASWSSAHSFPYTNYYLDNSADVNVWEPQYNNLNGCWIQVSTAYAQYWT